jgi:hypothetical protein
MSKYHAKPEIVDGIRFASQREAKRYRELRLLVKANQITALDIQPNFPILVKDVPICRYVGDFAYLDYRTGRRIVEDVKGVKTPVYRLKKKLVKAIYGIDIQEI